MRHRVTTVPVPVGARALVVDDDAMIRRSLSTALVRAGFAVTTADDAVPAMSLTESFDVMVVDYNMQTATGAEVVRHFKNRFGDQIFCVVLSGEDDEGTSARCRDAGADAVMTKPTMPSDLRRCLAKGLNSIRVAA
ncbi:MAG: response regulator [Deltaproteobacteria bacterium]|nr:response regulator [Deltaproteobacteria bacterium]